MQGNQVLILWLLTLFYVYCDEGTEKDVRKCPRKESIEPCRCHELWKSQELWLTCSDLQSPDSLRKVFRAVEDIKIDALKIERSAVTNFTKSVFEDFTVTDIFISSTNLTSISEGDVSAFQDTRLQKLSMSDCGLRDDTKCIEGLQLLKTLQILILNDNFLQKIKASWFANTKKKIPDSPEKYFRNLRFLQIRRNQIDTVESRAFQSLENLMYLDLSENQIKYLKADLFPKQLYSLVMSYNEITDLQDGLFKPTRSLGKLYLDHNNLTILKKGVWEKMYKDSKLKRLDLRGNSIACDCSLLWLPCSHRDGPWQFYGLCHLPKHLNGRVLSSITEEDLHCDLHCDYFSREKNDTPKSRRIKDHYKEKFLKIIAQI